VTNGGPQTARRFNGDVRLSRFAAPAQPDSTASGHNSDKSVLHGIKHATLGGSASVRLLSVKRWVRDGQMRTSV